MTAPLSFKGAVTDEHDDFDGLLALIICSVILGCLLTLWKVFHGSDFDFEKFGTGIASIIGAGGMGYGAKRLGEKYGRSDPCDPKE